MGGIYLTDIAKWLRDAGLTVKEYDGWQDRSRSSGGYDQMPLCVMWHHTASPASWDGQKDADYCAVGHEDSPISNLYIDRSGTVWILAGGASNTNGKGKSITFSRGTVPSDSMNTRALGVEMGNDGVGERWPQAQIDAMFTVSNTCNAKFGNRPDDMSTHNFYAPDRKIDPATCNVAGPWVPRSCTSSGSWDRSSVQEECVNRYDVPPPITPDDEEDMLFDGFWQRDNDSIVYAIFKDGTKKWVANPDTLEAMANLYALHGATDEQTSIRIQRDPGMFAAFGVVIGEQPNGHDSWGNRK